MARFNILYQGNIIHKDLTHEECAEILSELSEKYFSGDDIDPNLITLEEI
jgi:NOL1/NOP2/fmu family ribosome biogenesis protein|tara:strand:- start:296 stop:445 length:150 start_codon:yes stop_codon:yes gene_type:complete